MSKVSLETSRNLLDVFAKLGSCVCMYIYRYVCVCECVFLYSYLFYIMPSVLFKKRAFRAFKSL